MIENNIDFEKYKFLLSNYQEFFLKSSEIESKMSDLISLIEAGKYYSYRDFLIAKLLKKLGVI